MLDYEIACAKFSKETVDALLESVGAKNDHQVVTDGERIFVCGSVGSVVPECWERVEGKPWFYDPDA